MSGIVGSFFNHRGSGIVAKLGTDGHTFNSAGAGKKAITEAVVVVADGVDGTKLADDAVDSEHYTDGSIDNAHIADDAIDSEHYAAGSIDNAHLADDAVDSDELAAGAVDTAHIADNQVTLAKMAGLARGKLIYGDASGDPAALAVGSADEVLTHDGTDLAWAAAGGGMTVGDITGATALAVQPAADDEIALSDAGTLKRLDIKHIQNTPAFAAYATSNQTITDTNYTKITFGTEVLDTDGTFATSRFTPAVAGKYFIAATLAGQQNQGNTTLHNWITCIFKNGAIYSSAHDFVGGNHLHSSLTESHSDILDLDADDYVEIYGYGAVSTESPQTVADTTPTDSKALGNACTFSGFRISGV